MRRSTAIVWAVLAACCCITLSSLPSISGADSVVTSRTYNTRALEVAQASPPDMAQAVGLFEKAYNLERDNLRAERRRLRKQLERDDKASGYNEYEDEVETPEAHEIRSRIRQMKLNMGEYLNNWGVSELRRSNLYTSRRILLTAIRLVPGHTDAETNLQTVEDQFSITQPLDTPEDDDPIEPREPRQRRKKKNRRRRDYDDEEEEEDRRSSKKRKGGKKGSRQDDDSVYERPAKRRPLRTPDPEPNVDPATKRKKRKPVLDLPRRVNTNENRKFPRVHVDHLDLEENREYATGRQPFILMGALEKWDFEKHWSPATFGREFPEAHVDFYPHNMDKSTVRPYITPIQKALEEQTTPTHQFPESPTHPGSYIQWNVNWRDWDAMGRNMGDGLPDMFTMDYAFLMQQHEKCFASVELQDEFTLKTHWRMVLIGNRGAGMFNHQDVLRTSSYQAQVAGAKRWHVCAPDQSRYIGPAGGVDAFDPDYTAYPLFRKAQCYDDVVETGEMIFYPADYWHQTENIRTPTISVTSTVMDQNNYELIIAELVAECRTQKFKWGFSPQLCEAIEKRCVPYWGDIFGEKKRKVDEEDQAIQKRHDEL